MTLTVWACVRSSGLWEKPPQFLCSTRDSLFRYHCGVIYCVVRFQVLHKLNKVLKNRKFNVNRHLIHKQDAPLSSEPSFLLVSIKDWVIEDSLNREDLGTSRPKNPHLICPKQFRDGPLEK